MAHLQGALAGGTQPGGRFPLLAVFLQSPWPWLAKYLKGILHGRYKPYPSYALNGKDGIYPIQISPGHKEVRFSIAGDWGTGTEESFRIAEQISAFRPDYTIHLGDVYYVGDDPEIDENFLGIQTTGHTPVQFPRGSIGTLTTRCTAVAHPTSVSCSHGARPLQASSSSPASSASSPTIGASSASIPATTPPGYPSLVLFQAFPAFHGSVATAASNLPYSIGCAPMFGLASSPKPRYCSRTISISALFQMKSSLAQPSSFANSSMARM